MLLNDKKPDLLDIALKRFKSGTKADFSHADEYVQNIQSLQQFDPLQLIEPEKELQPPEPLQLLRSRREKIVTDRNTQIAEREQAVQQAATVEEVEKTREDIIRGGRVISREKGQIEPGKLEIEALMRGVLQATPKGVVNAVRANLITGLIAGQAVVNPRQALEIMERPDVQVATNTINNIATTINKKIGEKTEFLPERPEHIKFETMSDVLNLENLSVGFAESLPQTVAILAANIVNPMFGLAYMFGVEGGGAVEEALEVAPDLSAKEQGAIIMGVGSVNAALEKTGIDAILGKSAIGKKLRSNIARALFVAVTEGTTETVQELNTALQVAGITGTEVENLQERLLESGSIGFVSGLMLGGSVDLIKGEQKAPAPEEEVKIEEGIEEKAEEVPEVEKDITAATAKELLTEKPTPGVTEKPGEEVEAVEEAVTPEEEKPAVKEPISEKLGEGRLGGIKKGDVVDIGEEFKGATIEDANIDLHGNITIKGIDAEGKEFETTRKHQKELITVVKAPAAEEIPVIRKSEEEVRDIVEPVEVEKIFNKTIKTRKELSEEEKKKLKSDIQSEFKEDFKIIKPSTPTQAAMIDIGKAFGTDVVFVEGTKKSVNFEGSRYEGNLLLLNNLSKVNPLHIIAHELSHDIERINPKSWDKLVKQITEFEKEGLKSFQKETRSERRVRWDKQTILREMIAYSASERSQHKDFWEKIIKQNPKAFKTLSSLIDNLLISPALDEKFKTSRHFKNLNRFDELLDEVFAENVKKPTKEIPKTEIEAAKAKVIEEAEIKEAFSSLQKTIESELDRDGIEHDFKDNVLELVEPTDKNQKIAEGLSDVFGLNIKFVKVNDPDADIFNGSHSGSVILLNENTTNPHLAVIGHELTHSLKQSNPGQYNKLKDFILKNADILDKFKKTNRARNIEESVMADEFISDIVGERFTDIEFWESLARHDKNLAQKLFDLVKEIINNITSKSPYSTKDLFEKDVLKEIQTKIDETFKELSTAAGRLRARKAVSPKPTKPSTFQKKIIESEKAELQKIQSQQELFTNPADDAIIKTKELLDDYHANKDGAIQKGWSEAARLQDRIKKSVGTKKYSKQAKELDMAIQVNIDMRSYDKKALDRFAKSNKVTDEQRKIYEQAQNLTPEQLKIAEDIIKSNKIRGDLALDAEIIKNSRDNYTMRLWKLDGVEFVEEPGIKRGKFKRTTSRAKQRVLEEGGILQGWSLGMELKIKGATNALGVANEELAKTTENKNLFNLARSADLVSYTQKEDYVRIDHPNFTGYKWAGKITDGSEVYGKDFITIDNDLFKRVPYYAEPALGNRLNKILGVSKLHGKPSIDVITRANQEIKQTILTTSLYHHQAFLRSYMLGGRTGLTNISPRKAYRDGLNAVNDFTPEVEDLVRGGMTLGKTFDWEETNWNTDEVSRLGKIFESIPGGSLVKEGFLNFRKAQTNFLFNKLGVGLKAQAGILEYRHMLRKHKAQLESGEITKHEVAKMVGKLMNDDFGGLHHGRLERDQTIQHIFRLMALAPDWTESNVRSMVKMVVQRNEKTGKIEVSKGIEGAMYRSFWARIALKGLLSTAVFNYLISAFDDDDFVERYKKAWDNGNLKWLEVDITPIYKSLVGEDSPGSEAYFSILGHFKDPVKFVAHPIRSAKHKASVFSKVVLDILTGSDWRGQSFTSMGELIGIDDKGVYKTTRVGKHLKGAPKGGKLKGHLTKFEFGKGARPLEPEQIASFLLYEFRGFMPIPVQSSIAVLTGEQDWFMGLTKAAGFHTGIKHKK